ARGGERLHGLSGWRGEFLAHAYFKAGGEILAVLHPDEVAAWIDLGVALQPATRDPQFFAGLPHGLERFKADERAAFFAAARALAEVDSGAAATFYAALPSALRRLPAALRIKLLQVLELAASNAAPAIAEVVPVVGALVRDIPSSHRLAALDLA